MSGEYSLLSCPQGIFHNTPGQNAEQADIGSRSGKLYKGDTLAFNQIGLFYTLS